MMDKRVGYGLSFEEAVKVAISSIEDLPDQYKPIKHISLGGGDIWAELREDGWRVYRKRLPNESIMSKELRRSG